LVWSNLRRIREGWAEYYRSSVRLSVVLDQSNAPAVARFLREEGLRADQVRISGRALTDAELASHTDVADLSEFEWARVVELARGRRLRDVGAEELVESGLWICSQTLDRIYRRRMAYPRTSRDWLHAGQCVPTYLRCHVYPDGRIFPCHMVPYSDDFAVGDVETGVQPDKICQLLNEFYRASSRHCHGCWAVRLCRICMRMAPQLANDLEYWCEATRASVHHHLVGLCRILEANPHAFQ